MTDKEMLDWVEKNVFKIRLQPDDTYLVDYYEGDGTQQESIGISLRDCIQKANPVKVLEGELYFRHKGIEMKAVPHPICSCEGCDCYTASCREINDSLESVHSARCSSTHQIMFVHSKDKEEYED
jgi:hypothetical protein